MPLTRRKFAVFAAGAVALAVIVTVSTALAADLYLHARAERSAGLNRWGYRGPLVSRKRPGEMRVVVLGGSTAFGYGVTWDEAMPAQLERRLNAGASRLPFSVVNLGFNNEGAYSFLTTLKDFAYLDYDIVCLYEGYNDLIGDSSPNRSVYRHQSVVFRLTGYYPILPLALQEKAYSLRYGGDLNAAYSGGGGDAARTVFRPNLPQRTTAAALETAAAVAQSLGSQLDKMSASELASVVAIPLSDAGCASPWVQYCDSIYQATQFALGLGKRVAIVGQPRISESISPRHTSQQRALEALVDRTFAGDQRVRYVDLRNAVDLSDQQLVFDGMHLNAEGNARIAEGLVEPVRTLAMAGSPR